MHLTGILPNIDYFCIKKQKMINIIKQKYRFTNTESWFADKIDKKNKYKFSYYRQALINVPTQSFYKEEFHTLLTNLRLSEEELFRKCSATVRNEIKRAEREGGTFSYNTSIENFIPFYNNFARIKGLEVIKESQMKAYGKHLIITEATFNNKVLASHSYIIDEELRRVRLYQSATQRFSKELDHNLIGRANKFLHYKDMLKFKELNYSVYDWGGIAHDTMDSNLIGINKFKKSFGGIESVEYNYASLPYIWFMQIKKIFKR